MRVNLQAIQEWSVDGFDRDDPLLVEQIRTRLLPRRGVRAGAGEILVTLGAQQALYLAMRLLLGPGRSVGLENPGYVDARNIALMSGARIKPLAIDAEGLLVDQELDGCDCVYVTPSHQSPSTLTLPLARREALLERAANADFLIFEDDYEAELSFSDKPLPALKSLDRNERVIYLGSLSKTLAPGLRMGYLVGPTAFIREARALRRLMIRHPAANNQRAVALFLARGYHDAMMRRLVRVYRERWEVLQSAMLRHLPQCRFVAPSGGSACWVQGPPGLDAGRLARDAAERGVLIEPGQVHFLGPDAPSNHFRLGYSSIALDAIEPGIRELARLLHGLRDQSSHGSAEFRP
jgi:GntR family transcriptional regulator / MocR family aminotransferase